MAHDPGNDHGRNSGHKRDQRYARHYPGAGLRLQVDFTNHDQPGPSAPGISEVNENDFDSRKGYHSVSASQSPRQSWQMSSQSENHGLPLHQKSFRKKAGSIRSAQVVRPEEKRVDNEFRFKQQNQVDPLWDRYRRISPWQKGEGPKRQASRSCGSRAWACVAGAPRDRKRANSRGTLPAASKRRGDKRVATPKTKSIPYGITTGGFQSWRKPSGKPYAASAQDA